MLLTRRNFLKDAAILSLAAGINSNKILRTITPKINRVGGPKLKTSLNAYSFVNLLSDTGDGKGPSITLFDLLEFCAKLNFDAIDPTGYFFPGYPKVPPDSFINEFKRRAFELGLDISGTGVRNNFAQPDKSKRKADVQHVKEWIEVAAKLGAPVIRVFAGPVPEGYENKWDEVAKWMVEDLKECVEYGRKFGVLIGVQNHGDFIKTAEQAIKIVDMVNSDWFGLIVDTGYFLVPDPYEDIAKAMPYAVNLQIKESPFGAGSPIKTDLKRLVQVLKDANYRGYCPIETLRVKGQPYDPYEKVTNFFNEFKKALNE